MTRIFLKSIVGTVLSLLVLVGGAHVSALGQDVKKSDQIEANQEGNPKRSLVGVWITQVTRRNCDTGVPIGNVSNIQFTYANGGTALETIGPSTIRSHGNGIWKREHGWNEYSSAIRFMRYDSAGAFVGSGVVRVALTLDETGDHSTSTATNDVLDANGNVIASGCATSVATRFQG